MGEAIFILNGLDLGALALPLTLVVLAGMVEGCEVVFVSAAGVGVSGRDGSMDANRGEVLVEGPYSDWTMGVSRDEKKSEK